VRHELYLDHAATTPVRDEVALTMEEARRGSFANPSSPHAAGRRAKAVLEDCRDRIRALVGATGRHDRLVFTSGATEANRLAVLGMAARTDVTAPPGVAACSARDHTSCVAAVADLAARRGPGRWEAARALLTPTGTLDPDWLRHWVAEGADRPHLLCTTLVCGQSGTIEPLVEPRVEALIEPRALPLAETLPSDPVAISRDVLVHIDATQAVGLLDVSFAQLLASARLPAATLAFAAHKFGGPRGIGGLVVRGDITLEPLTAGPQEQGLRGGTEPVVLAVGFARALELAVAERRGEAERLAGLRDLFETRLGARAREVGVEAHIVGGQTPASGLAAPRRAPHISTVAFSCAGGGRGIDRQAFVMAADLEGVCVATGTACASGSSEPAPALAAMGLPEPLLQSAVRFSFGRDTTPAVIEEALVRLGGVLARMAGR
jgi:cysteine desulfurase